MNSDQEVVSYGYPSEYKLKSINEQCLTIRKYFPRVGFALERFEGAHLFGIEEANYMSPAEGWFAVPRWEIIASTYNLAVVKALKVFKVINSNVFLRCFGSQDIFVPEHLQPGRKKIIAFNELCLEKGETDILVFPAQFGLYYRNCSPDKVFKSLGLYSFGLGLFELIIKFITHPEILQSGNHLGFIGLGDEFCYNNEKGRVCFSVVDNCRYHLDVIWDNEVSPKHGAVTGFKF